MNPMQPLYAGMLAVTEDPHSELLALVWGPRFDREHGQGLLARLKLVLPAAQQALQVAADRFDRLPAQRQQRLRELILRDRARLGAMGQSPHAPHPAD